MPREDRRRLLELAHAIRVRGPIAVSHQWLEEARAALLEGDDLALEALSFGYGSAVRRNEIVDGIGVIEVRWPLLEGGGFFTDYTDIRRAVEDFAENPAARAILLDIDSPGGVVHGAMWQAAERIRELRAEKPIWAVANDQATSAAYLLASQAGRVLAGSRSAALGSLGVIATHVDRSEANKQRGIRVSEIVTGRLKNLLSPHRPLGSEGRAFLQELVETTFGEFIAQVTAARSALTEERIRALEGGVFLGAAAVERRLADEVLSVQDALERLREEADASSMTGAAGPAPTTNGGEAPMDEQTRAGAAGSPSNANPEPQPTGTPAASGAGAGGAAPPQPPAPEPTAAAPDGNVVSLEQARGQGARAERERVTAIQELGRLAGLPDVAERAISEGHTVEQARRALVEAKASADEATAVSGHHAGGGGDPALPELSTHKVYQRWNKTFGPARHAQ